MKKIVAVLLVVATLSLPLCGLADMNKTVGEIFALTDEWEYVKTLGTLPKDVFYFVWIPAADCFSFTYNQEIYTYTGYRAELLMAACVATAFADASLTYNIDWGFSVNGNNYTKAETMIYVLNAADKYLN